MDCIVNDPDPFFAPVCDKRAGLWSRANHPLSDWYELLWNVLAWTVIATALVLASTGTARLTARLLKWPCIVAAATVLLTIAQLYWGAYLAFYLATCVPLWAGGSL
jgi:hypothetical protein